MQTRWRTKLLACAVAAAMVSAGVGVATRPPARAQATPTGDTGSTSCPASNPPNELVLVGGTPQTAQLETAFANALQVELANTDGCPVTTAVTATPVTFTAPASGPSATFTASGSSTLTVGTDATGRASVPTLTANETPGPYTLTASSAYGSVSFSLTNTAAGIPATIAPVAPTSRHTTVNHRYRQPLTVRVLDANHNPVANATVSFTVSPAGNAPDGPGASFDDHTTQTTQATNAEGLATSPRFSANDASGTFTATATVAHVIEPARFTLHNFAAKPNTITAVGSGNATATIGTPYPHRLEVRVRSGAGKPVWGATVTFTLGSSSAAGASTGSAGAGATFTGGATQATATTDRHGAASSPRLAANDQAGRFTATATATGVSAMVVFHLHNHAAAPSTITAGIGAAQSTPAGTRFAIPLAVTVTDAHGNRVPGVLVTFTAPPSGPGGGFAHGRTAMTVKTNASGIAIAPPFTANGELGGYIVTASVGGVRPVAFALVNTSA